METKICSKCKKEKNINDFYYNNSKNSYCSCCKECTKIQVNLYREKNKENISKLKYTAKKNKLKQDKVYWLKNQMNNLIYYSFKRKRKYRKTSKATKIFGCDWNTFYNYLLQTFKNNYGYEYNETIDVQVDHIIPLCTAKTIEDVIKLNHFSNLQLLTSKDNKEKYIY